MLSHTKVVDIEISQPLQKFSNLSSYNQLRGIVRFHGLPIGFISAPITFGNCDISDVIHLLMERFGDKIATKAAWQVLSQGEGNTCCAEELFQQFVSGKTENRPESAITMIVCPRQTSQSRLSDFLTALKNIRSMPLEVIIKVFGCYILPMFEYGLILWISGNFAASTGQAVNATFSKYLKRYLSLPLCTNNSMVYFITNTLPLMTTLKQLSHKRVNQMYLPECMSGTQITFFNNLPEIQDELSDENWLIDIPSFFWRSRAIWRLPSNHKFRRKHCREVCDTDYEHCKNQKQLRNSTQASCSSLLVNAVYTELHPNRTPPSRPAPKQNSTQT